MPRQFQFVSVSNPTEPVSSDVRKLTHSHAIRQVHAEERRLRTQRYRREVLRARAEENRALLDPGFVSRMLSYGRDPFSTLARPLSSQEHFLLDHYVRVVVPYSAMHCGLFEYPGDHHGQILRDWVGLAITDKNLLDAAVLLSACRNILHSKPDDLTLTQMTLQYKQRGLQTLRQAVGGVSSPVNILTVAKALALSFDEHLETWLLFPCAEKIQCTMSSLTPAIPVGSWVLVTGATGFVASHVTRQFLERGYKVRGTVRDLAQASWLADDHFKTYVESGDLELVAVPDLAADGAFDEAVKGVLAVAHIATITSFDPDPNNVVPQTVAGVTSILKAAAEERSVQQIVFTSSIMAAILPLKGDDTRVARDTWNEVAVQAAWAPPPYEPSRAMFTYAASKVAAEKEVWNFVEENNPHYTVNVICPSGILGEPLHKKHAETPANWVAALFKGDKASLDPWPAAFFVDIHDIALLHVAAILDPEVKNARLHTWGHSSQWNEFLAVLRKLRPQKEFIADYPDPYYLTMSTDQSESIALLKKWAGQDGWKPLKDSISESIENPYFQFQ
ncbi:hypothetical protein B0T10DRAFT_539215 [Thelonectria olida]|uniref:NAD-dependent epimerase/dehydratase domain-containing protein n=1 Tax=Thelonectria olida TaxID=1576542 RepID=A0A9P8W1B6_9HYPO|nr:hypothetical protein B0T10DRAFT_539215 [Thelonectria olida]